MKQFLTVLAMSLILLVSCENQSEDTTTQLVIKSETPFVVPFSGGECSIDFAIKNPIADVKLKAVANEWWISNVTVGDDKVTFVAQRNTTTEERTATIRLTYGEIEHIVEIRLRHPGYSLWWRVFGYGLVGQLQLLRTAR